MGTAEINQKLLDESGVRYRVVSATTHHVRVMGRWDLWLSTGCWAELGKGRRVKEEGIERLLELAKAQQEVAA